MHCVNSSIFHTTFLHTPSLSTPTKIRLLEWKVRNDLAMYASRASPSLHLSEIMGYEEARPEGKGWEGVIGRVNGMQDDGHASKLVRALAHGEKVCARWEKEGKEGFKVKGDMWRVVGNMVLDSLETGGPSWVRGCGFEEAWGDVPLRGKGRL
jgi:hypothetical protein